MYVSFSKVYFFSLLLLAVFLNKKIFFSSFIVVFVYLLIPLAPSKQIRRMNISMNEWNFLSISLLYARKRTCVYVCVCVTEYISFDFLLVCHLYNVYVCSKIRNHFNVFFFTILLCFSNSILFTNTHKHTHHFSFYVCLFSCFYYKKKSKKDDVNNKENTVNACLVGSCGTCLFLLLWVIFVHIMFTFLKANYTSGNSFKYVNNWKSVRDYHHNQHLVTMSSLHS